MNEKIITDTLGFLASLFGIAWLLIGIITVRSKKNTGDEPETATEEPEKSRIWENRLPKQKEALKGIEVNDLHIYFITEPQLN